MRYSTALQFYRLQYLLLQLSFIRHFFFVFFTFTIQNTYIHTFSHQSSQFRIISLYERVEDVTSPSLTRGLLFQCSIRNSTKFRDYSD